MELRPLGFPLYRYARPAFRSRTHLLLLPGIDRNYRLSQPLERLHTPTDAPEPGIPIRMLVPSGVLRAACRPDPNRAAGGSPCAQSPDDRPPEAPDHVGWAIRRPLRIPVAVPPHVG